MTDSLFPDTFRSPSAPRLEGGHSGGATFSPCPSCPLLHSDVDGSGICQHCGTPAVYRYNLWRCWGEPLGRYVLWFMLNPSKADAYRLDPSLRRCKNYSQAWGYDGMVIRNPYPYRATEPKDMLAAADPIGPVGIQRRFIALRSVDEPADTQEVGYIDLTIVGWGANAPNDSWMREVFTLLPTPPHALAITAGGAPRHPLYLAAKLTPKPYPEGFLDDDPDDA